MWHVIATMLATLIQAVLDRLDHSRLKRDNARLELERDATHAELEVTRRTSASNAQHRDADSTADRLRDGTF